MELPDWREPAVHVGRTRRWTACQSRRGFRAGPRPRNPRRSRWRTGRPEGPRGCRAGAAGARVACARFRRPRVPGPGAGAGQSCRAPHRWHRVDETCPKPRASPTRSSPPGPPRSTSGGLARFSRRQFEAVAVSVGLRARMRVNRHRVAGCFLLPVASHSALRRRFLASIRRRCGLSHRPRGVVTFRSSRATTSVCRFPAARPAESSNSKAGRARHSGPAPRDARAVAECRALWITANSKMGFKVRSFRCLRAPPRQDLRHEGQRSTSRTVTTLSREPGSRPRIPPRP